ncbi:MAG: hypothetical protein AAFV53_00155 [Myxococcota bacterium]
MSLVIGCAPGAEGDACDVDDDCEEGLACDVPDGDDAGTCETPEASE